MARNRSKDGVVVIDDEDRRILRLLQADASKPLEHLAKSIGMSKTAIWNRIQRLQQEGVILRQAVILDAKRVGLLETFFVSIRTSKHRADWLEELQKVIDNTPEVTEAHRLAGHLDYLLKVQVATTKDFDLFYQNFVAQIDLFDVTSSLSMQVLKCDTALPL